MTQRLRAHCRIVSPEPQGLAGRVAAHYREHGEVDAVPGGHRLRIAYGEASLWVETGGLHVEVEAGDESDLAYMKMGLVHHLRAFSDGVPPELVWQGDGLVGSAPPFYREMEVVEAFDLTPAMRRVVLRGENLRRFASGGLHMRLVLPPQGRGLVAPVMGADGCAHWPEGEDATFHRVYTMRRIDPERGEVVVDMLRHDGDTTPGSRFAAHAHAGQRVGMTGPGGGGAPQAPSLFLFGDETAIPAIGRIFEELGPGKSARAVIQVAGREEEQPLPSPGRTQVEWLHRGKSRSLADAALALTGETLGDDGFVWAGCEFADFKAIRRHCRATLKLARERHLVTAYWRRGACGDDARGGD